MKYSDIVNRDREMKRWTNKYFMEKLQEKKRKREERMVSMAQALQKATKRHQRKVDKMAKKTAELHRINLLRASCGSEYAVCVEILLRQWYDLFYLFIHQEPNRSIYK